MLCVCVGLRNALSLDCVMLQVFGIVGRRNRIPKLCKVEPKCALESIDLGSKECQNEARTLPKHARNGTEMEQRDLQKHCLGNKAEKLSQKD